MAKIKLNILGLSYSQTQTGAYALILTEENGKRRIPIIIGGVEAQSIAIFLEELSPPRPLTHDLFLSFAKAFEISLKEVNIFKLEEGIFYSELICTDGKKTLKIDSRTSDAVALALRFKCPIYTTEEIISRAGIQIEIEESGKKEKPVKKQAITKTKITSKSDYSRMSMGELNEQLNRAVENENYEKASVIRDEIKRRSGK
ncbi:bifunctional nuclease domain-containing protein [Bacteroidota bacterium]